MGSYMEYCPLCVPMSRVPTIGRQKSRSRFYNSRSLFSNKVPSAKKRGRGIVTKKNVKLGNQHPRAVDVRRRVVFLSPGVREIPKTKKQQNKNKTKNQPQQFQTVPRS